jgi:hypothetical protein
VNSRFETCKLSLLIVRKKDGNAQLTRFGLDGSDAAAITGGEMLSPVCSPDEKFVYYLNFARQPKGIQRISTEDGSTPSVAKVLGGTLSGNLTISPDGTLLAYPYQQYSPPLVALAVLSISIGRTIKSNF